MNEIYDGITVNFAIDDDKTMTKSTINIIAIDDIMLNPVSNFIFCLLSLFNLSIISMNKLNCKKHYKIFLFQQFTVYKNDRQWQTKSFYQNY